MTEPSRSMQDALSRVRAPWDAARTERTLMSLPSVRRKQRVRRAFGGGLAGALMLVLGFWVLAASPPGRDRLLRAGPPLASRRGVAQASAPDAVAGDGDARLLRLTDGSRVALLDAQTDVAVESVSDRLIALHLHRGRAQFEVSTHPERVFRVRTAELAIEVLGTRFEVEQRDRRTYVRVTRGRVAVLWEGKREELTEGEEALFPPVPEATPARPSDDRRRGRKRSARALVRPDEDAQERNGSWRDHAEAGDFGRAFRLLPEPATVASMDVSQLMLAADAARLSGHPRAALPFLERVVSAHARDERAPLAAFTLGSVLMHQLGRPREAEAAYATARATTKSAELAQDALARRVEAAHRAGDPNLARKLAREYLAQYPTGRRVHAVRRFGRL